MRLPRHVAIIMDGNGRWAKARRLPRIVGHRAGVNTVREITTACAELGIPALTLYAFSADNWKRPSREVGALMGILVRFLRLELPTMRRHQVRLRAIGHTEALPPAARAALRRVTAETARHRGMILTLALNYSARQEILDGARKLAGDLHKRRVTGRHGSAGGGTMGRSRLHRDDFRRYLATAHLPDPDLLIRTSGEMRLSDFLLWQAAYAELWFTPVLWPDFRRKHLMAALRAFARRQRRYGGVEDVA
ncbi:MAG: polyprenyl diphosphate synthase [Candidatus Coatesbacteria bacterium]